MSTSPRQTFDRLIAQVEQIEMAASRAVEEGHESDAPILRRSALVLAVASIDTYFHEQALRLLVAAAASSNAQAIDVATYCTNVSAGQVAGPQAQGLIRIQLSYKTLVSPAAIDKALSAAGLIAADVWRLAAIQLGTRPDRLRLQLDLLYDRRNQIAHEGDWDAVQLQFRNMERAHLSDCTEYLQRLVVAIDSHL